MILREPVESRKQMGRRSINARLRHTRPRAAVPPSRLEGRVNGTRKTGPAADIDISAASLRPAHGFSSGLAGWPEILVAHASRPRFAELFHQGRPPRLLRPHARQDPPPPGPGIRSERPGIIPQEPTEGTERKDLLPCSVISCANRSATTDNHPWLNRFDPSPLIACQP